MGYKFQALFFRITDPGGIVDKIRREYDEVEVTVHPGAAYVCVSQGNPTYQRLRPRVAEQLSKGFADIIHVQVSSWGSFHYEHWVNGRMVRGLFWAEGAAWEVDGEPEAWEAEVFSSETPSPGSMEPFIDPEAVYQELQDHFKLPPLG